MFTRLVPSIKSFSNKDDKVHNILGFIWLQETCSIPLHRKIRKFFESQKKLKVPKV